MPRKTTEKLRSYAAAMEALDREARAVLIELLQEEELLGKAGGGSSQDLIAKYGMNNTTGGI